MAHTPQRRRPPAQRCAQCRKQPDQIDADSSHTGWATEPRPCGSSCTARRHHLGDGCQAQLVTKGDRACLRTTCRGLSFLCPLRAADSTRWLIGRRSMAGGAPGCRPVRPAAQLRQSEDSCRTQRGGDCTHCQSAERLAQASGHGVNAERGSDPPGRDVFGDEALTCGEERTEGDSVDHDRGDQERHARR